MVVETLIVTPSGALSPGALSAAAVAVGAAGLGAAGGLLVALGHMAFELPYVGLLVFWAERLGRVMERLEKPLSLVVLGFALYFAVGLLDAARSGAGVAGSVPLPGGGAAGAFLAGVVFTGFNPYFLAWWLTIGLPLVRGAAEGGARGFAAMYASHVWMDYAWLGLLAAGGGAAVGSRFYPALLAGLALLLVVFAVDIVARAFTGRRLLPF